MKQKRKEENQRRLCIGTQTKQFQKSLSLENKIRDGGVDFL